MENYSSDSQVLDGPDEPHVPDSAEEIRGYPPIPFPDLREFESAEWKDTEESWFVDSSGMGSDNEPALTVSQFKLELEAYHKANPTHGFGLTGMGQFQVYMSAFAPA